MMDALAYDKAIVASPLACEGLVGVQDEHHLLQYADDAQFADGICELLANPAKREWLGTNALAGATDFAAPGRVAGAFARLYQSVRE